MRYTPRAVLILALAAGLPASAAENDARILQLKAGIMDTRGLPDLLAVDAPFDAGVHYLLQLDGPMTAARSAALAVAGAHTGQYLPHNAFIADLSTATPKSLRDLGFVVWAGEFSQGWKVDPNLGKRTFKTPERMAQAAVGMSQVAVVLFDGEPTTLAAAQIAKLGGRVDGADMIASHWAIAATIPTLVAPRLAQLPSVQWIEDASEAAYRNDSNRWILQSNIATQTPIWDHGIHGQNQVGGLIDGAPRLTHCMFTGPGKVVGQHGGTGSDTHGTHTAGTFLGDQSPYDAYTLNDGMAYSAKLTYTTLNSITSTNLQTSFQTDHNDGARVHSNSWGDDGTTAYTTWCQSIDAFTYANEDDLVCFAVSNGSTVTTPENAINVLGTAASQDTPNQANHCYGGTGPTADGRRKPEIYAPGCNTTSANAATTCGVTQLSGTSMSCPAISGSGLLVRQYFTDGFYPSGAANATDARTPSGALIKATLLNATVDMTGMAGYPSNAEGWGRLLLHNTLTFTGDAVKLFVADVRNAGGLSTGQSAAYPISVATSGLPLKITLVFTAPSAAVNAANPVINDLNLELSGPGGLMLGNVFSSGQSIAGGLADPKNNVEMVLLNAPAPGAYTITVRAAAVNQGLQGYAVVATGDLGVACSSPGISSPPLPLTVADGQPAFFNVTATGTSPSYQWRKDTLPLSDSATITGSHTPNLLITPTTLADAGSYDVVVSNGCGSQTTIAVPLTVTCYANCDGSTTAPILNVLDFSCFLNRFAAGDTYANCDNSTTAPVLNVLDFSCFLNTFAAGCP